MYNTYYHLFFTSLTECLLLSTIITVNLLKIIVSPLRKKNLNSAFNNVGLGSFPSAFSPYSCESRNLIQCRLSALARRSQSTGRNHSYRLKPADQPDKSSVPFARPIPLHSCARGCVKKYNKQELEALETYKPSSR